MVLQVVVDSECVDLVAFVAVLVVVYYFYLFPLVVFEASLVCAVVFGFLLKCKHIHQIRNSTSRKRGLKIIIVVVICTALRKAG